MKYSFASLLVFCNFFLAISATYHTDSAAQDTLLAHHLDEVIVSTSIRETNDLRNIPASISIVSPMQLRINRMEALPDLSAFVPNLFIPSYGSRVSTPIYIRGIGTRSGVQAVSMYVNGIPVFNPAAFDFQFQDIQRIEVLRGAQGTLYGRNAIGGIINVYTHSPLLIQGTSAVVTAGNFGQFSARVSTHQRLSNNMGISLGGHYHRDGGFFINDYTEEKQDASENFGGRMKVEWNITPRLHALLFSNFDYLSQGAFPYMPLNAERVNFNDPAHYERRLVTSGLSLRYLGNGFSLNSTTGYQFLRDNMKMDQDFSPLSVFNIHQRQRQHTLSQEITLRSENNSCYRWVIGAFGFKDHHNIHTTVNIGEDGTAFFSQFFPDFIQMLNKQIEMPGEYRKPTSGLALFHQSTLNDLFAVNGLSATAGIRLDYEHTGIRFDTGTQGVGMIVRPPMPPHLPPVVIELEADTTLQGRFNQSFFEILPKFALQYRPSERSFFYLSASRGYKSGGFNEQSFSHILRDAMMEAMVRQMPPNMIPPGMPIPGEQPPLEKQLSFAPEKSWTFEFGGRNDFFDRRLSTTFALFYSQVNNIQIVQMLDGGTAGRIITNAGESTSKGVELGLRFSPTNNFSFHSEYGFANARFKRNDKGDQDLSGNRIPFAPQHTLSVGVNYMHRFSNNAFLDRFVGNIRYTGAGKVYWNEENTAYQPFYGVTNISIAVERGGLGLELWGQNVFNTSYNAFFVEVSDMAGNSTPIVQRSRPARVGVTLRMFL